jgi:hypothetical protein
MSNLEGLLDWSGEILYSQTQYSICFGKDKDRVGLIGDISS